MRFPRLSFGFVRWRLRCLYTFTPFNVSDLILHGLALTVHTSACNFSLAPTHATSYQN